MDTGPEPISEAEELRQIQRQSRAVYMKSLVTAAVLTGLALVP